MRFFKRSGYTSNRRMRQARRFRRHPGNSARIANRRYRVLRRGFSEAAHLARQRMVNRSIQRIRQRQLMSKVMYRKGLPLHLRKYVNKFI